MRFWNVVAFVFWAVTGATAVSHLLHRPLFPNSDFEQGTLANWNATGDAFDGQPIRGDHATARGRGPSRHKGSYWLGTFERKGDAATGTLTSREFVIDGKRIAFLIGAGDGTDATSVELWIGGSLARREISTGLKSGAEAMHPVAWDVSSLRNARAFLRIRDQRSGPWGHINVDDFHYE